MSGDKAFYEVNDWINADIAENSPTVMPDQVEFPAGHASRIPAGKYKRDQYGFWFKFAEAEVRP